MIDDDNGLVFTMDIMLALIVFTIIIGISAQTIENLGFHIGDALYINSLEKITTHSSDILLNTPGSPYNWETKTSISGVTPGLASIDSQGKIVHSKIISSSKVKKLKENYQSLVDGKIVPMGFKSSMMLYPSDPSLSEIEIKKEPSNLCATDICIVNRTVILEMPYETLVSINSKNRTCDDICAHRNLSNSSKHTSPDLVQESPGWTCSFFVINTSSINTTDFYLVTEPNPAPNNARWIIDKPDYISDDSHGFDVTPLNVNAPIISLSTSNQTNVLWFHVYSSGKPQDSFKANLIAVPKGTNPCEINSKNSQSQPYYFILKIWI
jgi:hypothetical protein